MLFDQLSGTSNIEFIVRQEMNGRNGYILITDGGKDSWIRMEYDNKSPIKNDNDISELIVNIEN